MSAAHCPGCTGHRVLSISGPIVTAQFGQPCPGVERVPKGCGCGLPGGTCEACMASLRAEVQCVREALKLAGLREHAGTWITEDEDRRISEDGP